MSDERPLLQIRRPPPPDGGTPVPRDSGLSRRELLQLAGSGAAMLATGCTRQTTKKLLPYSNQPPEVRPGIALHYATSMIMDGYAVGLIVESHEGRPTKVEGNPEHPASLGATGVFEQAAVRQLYDSQRARDVRHGTDPSFWDALVDALHRDRSDGGAGLRLLMQPSSSPLHGELLAQVAQRFPAVRVTFHSAIAGNNLLDGARLAFGRELLPRFDLRQADALLLIDDDLLGASSAFSLRYARQFATRRSPDKGDMNRLYVVEQDVSSSGSIADHRLAVRRGDIGPVVAAIAAELPGLPAPLREAAGRWRGRFGVWPAAVARDLGRRPAGHTLVTVGEGQPPEVHALVHAMNAALGNLGHTVELQPPALLTVPGSQDLGALAAELQAGKVDTLVVLGGNPAYTAPADLELASAIRRAKESFYLGLYDDETSACCSWFGPGTHFLEEWGDARAYDGTLSVVQPLLQPLFGGRTVSEWLGVLAGERSASAYRLMRASWARRAGVPELPPGTMPAAATANLPLPPRQAPPADQPAWQQALRRGFVDGSSAGPVTAQPDVARVTAAVAKLATGPTAGQLQLSFAPSPTLYDGRFANNPWLLEQPAPVNKLTWDNAVLMSPATAQRLGVTREQVVELTAGGRRVEGPVLTVPGHADEAVTVWLGYGRRGTGERNARGVGFDAGALRTQSALHVTQLELRPTRRHHRLALSQQELSHHDRPVALRIALDSYRRHPTFTEELKGVPAGTLYDGPQPDAPLQWAMTIDLGLCTGCSACVMACRAENNMLVVGKHEVLNHRQMDWLRIDTYFDQSGTGRPINQPMMCQHCGHAPCEYVCPVNATVHSTDGLNEMVYNRCVGTRFCSNNCPYKVRRFNWFRWTEREPSNRGLAELQRNPDVTVRERGVMEKCTYCVQRIRRAEIDARNEGREVRPGEVVTACAQACPTRAIQFGSLTHPDTDMVRGRRLPRSFEVLHELDTRPRTMYLARVDNPNEELA